MIQEKIIIPAPFHSKAFVLPYKFETSWTLLGGLSRGILLPSQGSPTVAFHEPSAPNVACYLLWQLPRRVSSVVPNLLSKKKYLSGFIPSSRFLSWKPSFLDDYLTTQHSDFSIFLVIYLTDKPVDRSIHAYAVMKLSVFRWEGLFSWYLQKQGRKSSSSGYKIQKHVAGKFTSAGTSFVRKYTNRIFKPQDGTASMKY